MQAATLAMIAAAALAVRVDATATAASSGSPAIAVRWENGRLSLRAHGAPAAAVVAAIAQRTGARVVGDAGGASRVTIAVDDEPVETTLGRLLGPASFTLRYDGDGRLRSVEILPSGDTAAATPDPPAPDARVDPPVPDDLDVEPDGPAPIAPVIRMRSASRMVRMVDRIVERSDARGLLVEIRRLYGAAAEPVLAEMATSGEPVEIRALAETALAEVRATRADDRER